MLPVSDMRQVREWFLRRGDPLIAGVAVCLAGPDPYLEMENSSD